MKTRFNLPEVTFTEKSPEKIEADILSRYKQITGQSLGLADPRRKFIQAIVPIITQQRTNIDFSAKQNLLAYSTGDYLEHIGQLVDTARLQSKHALTTFRVTLYSAQPQAITVPAGTRVTPGDNLYFATTETLTIAAGETTADVGGQCMDAGTIGNGFLPGQISKLVDPVAWVKSIANVTESTGGVDIEADNPYAERIRIAPESFSTAGPDGAYEYWAKTASQLIVDVRIHSPFPGVVEIRPLLQGGEIPGQEIIDAVLVACSDKKVRPLTDNVQVLAPEAVNYGIVMTYWIDATNASVSASIQQRVGQAVQDYITWQKSKLGRAVDPSELIARVKNAGASRVAVTTPTYQAILKYQVAIEDDIAVTYGGLE